RQAQGELGLAAGLEAGAVARAVAGDRLDDDAPLVDLDRVHALVPRAVPRRLDRARERVVDAVQAVLDEVGAAQRRRRAGAQGPEVGEEVDDRHARALATRDGDALVRVDAEVAGRPRADAVELAGVRDGVAEVEGGAGHHTRVA